MFFTAQTRPHTIISVAPKAQRPQAQKKIEIGNMTEAQAKQYILEMRKGK